MKKAEIVKMRGRFDTGALRVLRQIPGITAIQEPGEAGRTIDAYLDHGAGGTRVAVEVRHRANAATAWQLVHIAKSRAEMPALLIADETTTEARAILGEHGIGVLDGLGNAHIELPGLLLHLEGRRRPKSARPARLSGKAGLIAQALLLDSDRRRQVQELAREAGTSVGLAHRVLSRLQSEGIVAAEGRGRDRQRHVVDPTALLDLWAEESTERRLRTLGYLLAPTPQALVRELSARLATAGIAHAVTGPAAANLVAPFVTAVPVTDVWVAAKVAVHELCEAAGAEAVAEGHNLVFLQAKDDAPLAFREQADGVWIANRFRLYADLRRDPRRGREQADYLRKELIGF